MAVGASRAVLSAARQWRRTYEVLEQDLAGMERVLWTSYEDLVTEPARELGRIAEFLGARAQLPLRADTAVRVHEREEPLRDMNPESLARLSDDDRRVIERVAGEYLAKYGYLRRAHSAEPQSSGCLT